MVTAIFLLSHFFILHRITIFIVQTIVVIIIIVIIIILFLVCESLSTQVSFQANISFSCIGRLRFVDWWCCYI